MQKHRSEAEPGATATVATQPARPKYDSYIKYNAHF